MAVNAGTRALAGRAGAALAAAAVVVAVASGCGGGGGGAATGGGGGNQSAADFIDQVTTQFSRGQSGPLWDTLHPADQAVVSRARYMTCQGNDGFDLQNFTVLASYADTIQVAGKATPSTAVSVRVTSDEGTTTATSHAVRVNGRWRWILPPADYAAYAKGRCPSTG